MSIASFYISFDMINPRHKSSPTYYTLQSIYLLFTSEVLTFSAYFLGHRVQSVPLRYVKHVLGWWLVKHSAVDGPEATQDSEQRAFSTTVGARDQQMHAFINLEEKDPTSPNMLLKTHERTYMQRMA